MKITQAMNTTLKKRTNKKSEDGLKKGDNPKTYIDDVVVRRHSDFCPLGMNLLQSVKPRCQMVLSRTFKQKISVGGGGCGEWVGGP